MEKNSDMHGDRWVEQRLASLNSQTEWQPDTCRGLARLREQQGVGAVRSRTWTRRGMAAAAAGLCLLALPAPRALAHRVCTACLMAAQGLANPRPVQASVKSEKDRKPAPDFTLNDAAGKPVKLSDLRGKLVLLNFWATWCGGCKVEIPWFMEFQQTYRDRGLEVLGVSFDEDGWKAVKPYIEQKKVNYRMMIGNESLAALYGGVEALPVTFLIDKTGRIAATHTGLIDKGEYKTEIEALLKGPGR